MAVAKKTTTKKTKSTRALKKSVSSVKSIPEPVEIKVANETSSTNSNTRMRIILGIIVLIVVIFAGAYMNRGMFLAARVNNSFITRFELDRKLETQFGQSVVEQMVSEQLIFDEASKKQIKVTSSEVDAKINEIKTQIGKDVDINDLLAQQGMTMSDLRRQIEIQLLVEKMTVGLVNVSDQEITEYIDKNRSTMTATDEATLKQEALDTLAAQKKSSAVQKWFTDLKSKSRIVKYL